MRIILLISLCLILLSSCSRMPYEQWNSKLSQYESILDTQMSNSAEVSVPDEFLFNGVYNATRNKDAAPYPILKKNVDNIISANMRIATNSQEKIDAVKAFKTDHAQKSIATVGPQWTDFQGLMTSLQAQEERNTLDIRNMIITDIVFDSICSANKISAVAMLDFEVLLAEKMNELEADFNSLKSDYDLFKRDITNRTDPRESMTAMNRMKQKVRQLDNEFHQFSNLYSRISSLRADAMLFQGPFIDEMAEIKLISQKEVKISGFLSELRKMVTNY